MQATAEGTWLQVSTTALARSLAHQLQHEPLKNKAAEVLQQLAE